MGPPRSGMRVFQAGGTAYHRPPERARSSAGWRSGMKIDEIEGIGPTNAAKLGEAGVSTTDDLLQWGANKAGRSSLEETTGISSKLILEWVNHVDLMRITGVGSEYSDLLEAAGVD